MAVRRCISLSKSNNDFANTKAKLLFDDCFSRYINFLINKEREKEIKRKDVK